VVLEPRQRRDQGIGEPRSQPAGGPVFQWAEIDVEANDWEMGVQTRTDEHGLAEDPQSASLSGPIDLHWLTTLC
jgi:hypothetical protein